MAKRNKWLSTFLMIALSCSLITGCGSGSGANVETDSSAASTSTEANTDSGETADTDLPEIIAQAQADTNFNAEGYPLVNETVKKTIMIRKPGNIGDVEEMETLKYIAEKMNIEIEWIVVLSYKISDCASIIPNESVPAITILAPFAAK